MSDETPPVSGNRWEPDQPEPAAQPEPPVPTVRPQPGQGGVQQRDQPHGVLAVGLLRAAVVRALGGGGDRQAREDDAGVVEVEARGVQPAVVQARGPGSLERRGGLADHRAGPGGVQRGGAVTAAGGAWNASIVAEVAVWGDQRLVARGLGSYIAEASAAGSTAKVVLGVAVMCGFVVLFNWVLWRPLHAYASRRLTLE